MTIRELTPDDAALFRTLRLDALRSDPGAFGQTLESALPLSDHEWRQRLEGVRAQGGAVLVAEQDGAAVGMCGVGRDTTHEKAAFLWGMFVAAATRGSGVGAALLREAEGWAMDRGYAEMHACVAAPNRSAVDFYRRQGYEIGPAAGTLRPGSEIPVHAIVKRLHGPER
jgi:ribosomal protein S18 acetylase RimI-like enzyme